MFGMATSRRCTPRPGAASWSARTRRALASELPMRSTATREACGTASFKSCSCLPSSCDPLTPAVPVMFPPGRAMLSTSPLSIASLLMRITTSGTVLVTCLAAMLDVEAPTTISSTFRSTSSVARPRTVGCLPRSSGTPRRGCGPRPSRAPAAHPRMRPNARQARRRGPRSGAPARTLGPGEGAARAGQQSEA